jgi:hypothetical protein
MIAYEKWLALQCGGSKARLAQLIYSMVMEGDGECRDLVFEWLKATGDKTYSTDTFLKAAETRLKVWNDAA